MPSLEEAREQALSPQLVDAVDQLVRQVQTHRHLYARRDFGAPWEVCPECREVASSIAFWALREHREKDEQRIAALEEIGRILAESQRRVAPLVARERETENVGSIMDFRMKGWSRDGTFAWLVERSAALEQIERALAGQTESA